MRKITETKQQLDNYFNKYNNYKKWLKKETSHYVFHYLSNSEAEKDIKEIAQKQEKSFEKIIKTLNISKPKNKIYYYLYPDQKTKKELMGDDGSAQSIYHDFTIHVVYAKGAKPLGEHEDTHLLSLPMGLSIGFFQEGLAEYTAGNRKWQGKTQNFWLKKARDKDIVSDMTSVMTHQFWMDSPDKQAPLYYTLAKLFVKFLIDNFGIEKFKEFYKQTDRLNTKKENIEIFEKIFKKDVETAEHEFIKQINSE